MKLFPYGHATHPEWRMAAAQVLAQVRGQMARPDFASAPTLALLYITDHYAEQARDILEYLSAELPEVTDWSGTVGVGVAANNVEYFDAPALVLLRANCQATSTACSPAWRRWAWGSTRIRHWSMPTPIRPTWAN